MRINADPCRSGSETLPRLVDLGVPKTCGSGGSGSATLATGSGSGSIRAKLTGTHGRSYFRSSFESYIVYNCYILVRIRTTDLRIRIRVRVQILLFSSVAHKQPTKNKFLSKGFVLITFECTFIYISLER